MSHSAARLQSRGGVRRETRVLPEGSSRVLVSRLVLFTHELTRCGKMLSMPVSARMYQKRVSHNMQPKQPHARVQMPVTLPASAAPLQATEFGPIHTLLCLGEQIHRAKLALSRTGPSGSSVTATVTVNYRGVRFEPLGPARLEAPRLQVKRFGCWYW